MNQPNLPFLVPISKNLTKAQKQESLKKHYDDIIHAKNEEYFHSQLEQLKKVISGE